MMTFRLPLLILGLALLLGAGQAPCLAADKENPDFRLLEQQKKIHRLQKGIEGQKSRVKLTREKENSLTTELDRLNQRIHGEGERLGKLKDDLAGHDALLLAKQAEIDQANRLKERAKNHIQSRLAAIYRMGTVGALNVFFSSNSLPDLLATHEYLESLVRHDEQVVAEYRQNLQKLEEAQLALREGKEALVKTITQVKTQEEELAASRQERMALLNKVRTEKKLYQMALEELEEAADKLSGTMAELKAGADREREKEASQPSEKKRRPETQGFARQKGKLPPPAAGTVTTFFGKNARGKFGLATSSNGIDIKTNPGAEITAIYDGTVVYAGFLRGYGNLLIIDHGDQYYSLVSRAARFDKQEGEPVVKGEAIGIMSDQEGLLGEGLHFEIRRGTAPENPLAWVNNAPLVIRATRGATN